MLDKHQYGYIYVMSNPSFRNNLLKIGQSSKNPSEFRKNELFTTGVPLPFCVEYYASIQDFAGVERNIHKRLQEWRVNKNREFFSCDLGHAIKEIKIIFDNREKDEFFSPMCLARFKGVRDIYEYFPDGNKKTHKAFRSDFSDYTLIEYFNNGKRKLKTNVVLGKENGAFKKWSSDGHIKKFGYMFNGKKQGEWKLVSADGRKIISYYDQGIPVFTWKILENNQTISLTEHPPPASLEKYNRRVFKGRRDFIQYLLEEELNSTTQNAIFKAKNNTHP